MADNNDEIDVVELLQNCYSFIKTNKWLLLVVFVLGSGLGYYKVKQRSDASNAYYRTQFIVHSDFVDNNTIYMAGRTLAFDVLDSDEKNEDELLAKINHLECTKDIVLEGQEPEVNMVFETSASIPVEKLSQLITSRIENDATFKQNFELAQQHYSKQMSLLSKNDQQESQLTDPKEILAQVKLMEKKQELEMKMLQLKNPVQCMTVAPTNKLYEAPKFSIVLMLGYGVILSIFAGLVVWGIGFLKKVLV